MRPSPRPDARRPAIATTIPISHRSARAASPAASELVGLVDRPSVDLPAAERAVRDLPFHSLCVHHLLPFHGVAQVAYPPDDRIVGLSKRARVVEMFSRRLQVQEQLTMQVANCLQDHLEPQGVGVVIEAEHLCMSLRGVQRAGARTETSVPLGLLRDDPRTRREFLFLVAR